MATPVIDQARTYLSLRTPYWVPRRECIAALLSHPGVSVDAINEAAAALIKSGELVEREGVVKDDQGRPTIFWREGRPL
jgi:hypothetical protein